MSLYGGIKFGSIGDEAAAAGGSSTQDKGSNGNGAARKCLCQSHYFIAARASVQCVSAENVSPAATSSTSVSGASTSKSIPKATGEWSASLKFAPRVNKPKPPTSSRTPGSGGFGASAHSGTSTPTSAISQSASPGPAGPGSGAFAAAGAGTGAGAVIERSADIVRSAEPKLVRTDEVMLGPDGKPLARAPAMTLAQDKAMRGAVSGSGPTKRDRDGRGENKRKKKKKVSDRSIGSCRFVWRARLTAFVEEAAYRAALRSRGAVRPKQAQRSRRVSGIPQAAQGRAQSQVARGEETQSGGRR